MEVRCSRWVKPGQVMLVNPANWTSMVEQAMVDQVDRFHSDLVDSIISPCWPDLRDPAGENLAVRALQALTDRIRRQP